MEIHMSKQKGETSSGGIGILGLLGVVFVTLKILEVAPVASWSWWWVTAPFWGGAAFVLAILIAIFLIALVVRK
jgi:hypothetical protein